MFRFLIVALTFFGLGALFFGGAEGAAAAGWLVLAPIAFVFKIIFFMFLFGMLAKIFVHGGRGSSRGPRAWSRPSSQDWAEHWRAQRMRRPEPVDRRSDEDRFEEWHAMYHAKREVDSWTADLPDTGENA